MILCPLLPAFFSKFPLILWNIVLALSFCHLSFLFPCPFFLFLLFCRRARCFFPIRPYFGGGGYFPIYRPLQLDNDSRFEKKHELNDKCIDPDMQIFGYPRIRICSYLYGSGSFHHQAKIRRKTLICRALRLLNKSLSLNDACKCTSSV